MNNDDIERLRVAIYRIMGGDIEPTFDEAKAIAEEVGAMDAAPAVQAEPKAHYWQRRMFSAHTKPAASDVCEPTKEMIHQGIWAWQRKDRSTQAEDVRAIYIAMRRMEKEQFSAVSNAADPYATYGKRGECDKPALKGRAAIIEAWSALSDHTRLLPELMALYRAVSECADTDEDDAPPGWHLPSYHKGWDAAIESLGGVKSFLAGSKLAECTWTKEFDGPWHTACGNAFQFTDDGIAENEFKHCPYCANSIVPADGEVFWKPLAASSHKPDAAECLNANCPAERRDALLDAAIEFIGTMTGMKPPPVETASPEVFAPFHAFVAKIERIIDDCQECLNAKQPATGVRGTK